MVTDNVNTLPPPRPRGRLRRALEAIPTDSPDWHPVGRYRTCRSAATVASRIRRGHLLGAAAGWDSTWRPNLPGSYVVYARRPS